MNLFNSMKVSETLNISQQWANAWVTGPGGQWWGSNYLNISEGTLFLPFFFFCCLLAPVIVDHTVHRERTENNSRNLRSRKRCHLLEMWRNKWSNGNTGASWKNSKEAVTPRGRGRLWYYDTEGSWLHCREARKRSIPWVYPGYMCGLCRLSEAFGELGSLVDKIGHAQAHGEKKRSSSHWETPYNAALHVL